MGVVLADMLVLANIAAMARVPYIFLASNGEAYEFPAFEPLVPTAVYLRISQDRTGEGAGIIRQLEDCLKYAILHRLTVVEVLEENDTSALVRASETQKGNKRKRPGFERLKSGARNGEFHAVVAWATDRLWRSVSDLDQLIGIVESSPHQFTLHAVQGGRIGLDDANGKLIARILGSVAQGEVELKSARQARAHKQAFEEGRFPGGRAPFGYKLGDRPGELTVHEGQSDLLHVIASGILQSGWTITEATRRIRGLEPERCGRMKPIALRKILTGPTVAGKRYYLPREAVTKGVKGGTWGEASWEAIFSEREWNLLRAALLTEPRKAGRPPRKSLLAGLLVCAWCGSGMGYSEATYKCSVTSGCGNMGISTKAVEQRVTAAVTALLSGRDNQPLLRRLVGVAEPEAVGEDLNAKLVILADQRKELTGLYRTGVLPADDLSRLLGEIQAEEVALETQRQQQVTATLKRNRFSAAYDKWEELVAGDDEESIAKKNLIFGSILDGVIIWPAFGGKRAGSKFDAERIEYRLVGMTRPFVPLNDLPPEEAELVLATRMERAKRSRERELQEMNNGGIDSRAENAASMREQQTAG